MATLNNGWFWGVLLTLHILSWFYNWLIDWLHAQEWMAQWTWLTVVVGVGYTLIGAAVAMQNQPLLANEAMVGVVLAFVATGIPMSVGDIRRVLRWVGNGSSEVSVLVTSEGESHDYLEPIEQG